jgi:hypothetical protein
VSKIDELRDNSFVLAKIEIRGTADGLLLDATTSRIGYLTLSEYGKKIINDALSRAVDAAQKVIEESATGKSVVLVDNRTTEDWPEVVNDN